MREKRNFAERSGILKSREARKKYFLVYEGKNTEDIYFDGIYEHRGIIGINPLIELVPIIRSYSEEGWSNPKKIVDRVMLNIQEAETGIISYETLLNWIMDYLSDEDIIRNNRPMLSSMWATLKMICENKMHVNLSEHVSDISGACTQIADYLTNESHWGNVIKDITGVIENRAITYDKEIDKICFIIDRDRKSFKSGDENNQYNYVLEQCRENGFGFYLSNPCFEFWLLMHFDEVKNLDFEKVFRNEKITTDRRYTEHELRKLLPGYSKSRYAVETLIDRINKAMQNEKLFCELEEELEHNIGSRVGLLIGELITK